jgi:hypothetical protein
LVAALLLCGAGWHPARRLVIGADPGTTKAFCRPKRSLQGPIPAHEIPKFTRAIAGQTRESFPPLDPRRSGRRNQSSGTNLLRMLIPETTAPSARRALSFPAGQSGSGAAWAIWIQCGSPFSPTPFRRSLRSAAHRRVAGLHEYGSQN